MKYPLISVLLIKNGNSIEVNTYSDGRALAKPVVTGSIPGVPQIFGIVHGYSFMPA